MQGPIRDGEHMEASSYRVVTETLMAGIRDGAFKPGERLPTEAELTRLYGVSRGTVRRAYLDLVNQGMVTRVRGRGSFPVRRPPYHRSFGSVAELLALSEDTLMEVVQPLETVVDPEAAGVLGLQYDEVLHLSYRRLHLGEPFSFTEVNVPPQLLQYLQGVDVLHQPMARSQATVLGILDREMPTTVSGSREIATAVAAPLDVAQQIECLEGEPVLRIERVHFGAEGRPVERCINWLNPHRYVYRLQLQRY